ncbi:response regulator [bacterium]|nr:response regulator [bacterium]
MSTSHEPSDTLLDQIGRLRQEISRPGRKPIDPGTIETALRKLNLHMQARQTNDNTCEASPLAVHSQLHAKEILNMILKGIHEGVITTDIQGKITLMNEEAEKLLGWSLEQLKGKPLREIFQIVDEPALKTTSNPVDQILATHKMSALLNHTFLKIKGGKDRFIEYSSAPILNEDRRVIGAVLVIQDVTEKQKMEAERLRANKMESLGFLAGGLAHDFNNLLTAILGNINIAKMNIRKPDEILKILTQAERAGERAKSLACQLLSFSKGCAPLTKPIAIAEFIRECVEFVTTGSNVQCRFSFEEKLHPVQADEGQLNQVISNLIINAIQAMPGGGQVYISGKNIEVTKADAMPLSPGNYVKISMEDQGDGIAMACLDKIFDPYFTTKKLGSQKGCGLGLATSYSIIKKHDGLITVDSAEGVGSTFHIYLPASQKDVIPAKKGCEEPAKCNGNVLVMDDEEILRQLSVEYLSRLGYQVSTACNGEEAIKLYCEAQQKVPFDAVIMDLTVPGGMGGKETIKKLREIDPTVKVVVSSGYSNDPIMADYKSFGFDAVMSKPFQVNELGNLLSDLMN